MKRDYSQLIRLYFWKELNYLWKFWGILLVVIFLGLSNSNFSIAQIPQSSNKASLVYPEKPKGNFEIKVHLDSSVKLKEGDPVNIDMLYPSELSNNTQIDLNKDPANGNYSIKNNYITGFFSIKKQHLIFLGRVSKDFRGSDDQSGGNLLSIPLQIQTQDKQSIDLTQNKNKPTLTTCKTIRKNENKKADETTVIDLMASTSGNSTGPVNSVAANSVVAGGSAATDASTSVSLPYYGPSSFEELICRITCFLQPIAIALAVFMLILSGLQFVLAQGNEEKIKKARNTLKWTVIGIAVVVGARLIVIIAAELLNNGPGGSTSCSC